jgi:hypothetical protein
MIKQIRTAAIAAGILIGCISCGDVVRENRSPVIVDVATIITKNGNVLLSDVATDAGGVLDDIATATIASQMKNVSISPTVNNQVTFNRYHVSFQRADGRNVEGVDVPFAFDGAVTATVPAGGSTSVTFEIVRWHAKEESPLAQLVTNRNQIATIATVTFYGADAVGNVVSASGTISVNFSNLAG